MATLATLALFLAAGLAACGSSGGSSSSAKAASQPAPHLTTVKMQTYPGSLVTKLLLIAKSRGYFQANGINAEFVPIESSTGGLAALNSGSIDIASASPENTLAAIQKGSKFEVVSGQQRMFWEVFVHSDLKASPGYPESIRALQGKTVGVTALGSNGQFMMEAMLADAGLPPSAVTFVAVGGGTT